MKKTLGLTVGERILWSVSIVVVMTATAFSADGWMNGIASLIGVTALLFVAKGYVIGQLLTIGFAVFYGAISVRCRYYGEAITYLGMSAPAALAAAIAWWKHPYQNTRETAVEHIGAKKIVGMILSTTVATAVCGGILFMMGTANLPLSIVSVATSFAAAYLTFFRSPYYAVAYAANDVVLIGMWVMMAYEIPSYWPMVSCFVMFLVNDLYGFVQWKKRQKRQQENDRN